MERHERISELFLEACERSPEERRAFLERECAGDRELLAEVESLLANDESARRFLQTGRGAGEAGALATTEILDENGAESRPKRIGRFRILQTIGEGGMGIVYLAEQERPVRRKVALKLIKAGMDTRQVVARFESERQALALMSHPNIARVFDGGATDRGRPWFAMEYVRGEPITTYCDRHRLETRERLELFCRVCDGVQHAHQKGVIHRDIKASNVLVAIQDGKPVPKLIDFGVAKATQQRLTEKTMFTQLGVLVGTPEYMSPEQAEMTGLDIDTRTDVYSLGVLLYELLVGALPFDPQQLRRAAFGEIARTIRESQPPLPSKRVSTLGDQATDSARNRRTEPATLVRRLRGDLDWITMKALDKDRTRRYASPSEFAADVRRHMSHEPVVASPPSATYRARKFVRRHRLGVSATAAVAIALVVGIVGTTVGLLRATRAEAEARREAATAEQISEFLVGLFRVSDPSEARGNTITAREILDRGARQIDAELSTEPVVRARLMATIGSVYRVLGLYNEAWSLVEQAASERRELLGEEHPRTLDSKAELAHLHHVLGRHEQAERLYLETLEDMRRTLGDKHPTTLYCACDLAVLYLAQGRYAEAESLFLETLEAQRQLLGEEHEDTLRTMSDLAALYTEVGREDEAEPLLVEALEASNHARGTDHPATLGLAVGLAKVYNSQHRVEQAARLLETALEGQRRQLGEGHPSTLATMNSLAISNAEMGRLEEAERLFTEVLDIRRPLLGPDHNENLVTTGNLANVYMMQERYDEAETLLARNMETQRHLLGERHPDTLRSTFNLACLAALQGQRDRALRFLRLCLDRGLAHKVIFDNPVLQSLHGDPEFEAIVAEVRRRIDEAEAD